MSREPECRADEVQAGVWRWSRYSNEHKVNLDDHAIQCGETLWLVDPSEEPDLRRPWPWGGALPQGVFLTNGNHERAACGWEALGVPISRPDDKGERLVPRGWSVLPLAGGGAGERCLWSVDRRTLVIGDALIHLRSRGLEILPDRYCEDPARLRRSLLSLRDLPVELVLFAHGDPLMDQAKVRLEQLLETS